MNRTMLSLAALALFVAGEGLAQSIEPAPPEGSPPIAAAPKAPPALLPGRPLVRVATAPVRLLRHVAGNVAGRCAARQARRQNRRAGRQAARAARRAAARGL